MTPLGPPKPVWWKVVVGSVLILAELGNMAALLQYPPVGNRDEILGMEAMGVIILLVGVWLIYSGVTPLRGKKP